MKWSGFVARYTKKYLLTISPGKGIILGILTCLFGGVAAFIVTIILQKLGLNPVEEWMNKTLIEVLEKYAPQAVDQVREEIERQQREGPGVGTLIIGITTTVIFNALGGLIGGAIGAALFKRAPLEATPAS